VYVTPATGHVRHLDLDDVDLAVRSWGDPAGRPLVFWHPLGDITSGAYLAEIAPLLTARGLRVVAPDGPGFGESPPLPPEQYAVPRLAGLVWRLVGELGLARPVLMGHSWGGVVMLAAAGERPLDVSALVLLDSGHVDYSVRPSAHPEWSLAERRAAIDEQLAPYADRAALLRELAGEMRRPPTDTFLAGLEPALCQTATGGLDQVVAAGTLAAAQHGMLQERPRTRWPALASVDLPVLLLLATEPEEIRAVNDEGAATVRALHPGAEVRALPGWGHDLIADGGPALGELVADWLLAQPADRNVLR
jgi:pimeloyl-ACP methyl ester carboxylesterase